MFLVISVLSGLLACSDKGDDSGGGDGDGGGDGGVPTADLVYSDANNYSYVATLDVATIDLAEGADNKVDWSGLTTDIRGRPVTPSEIDLVTLVAFNVTKEEVLDSINTNSLNQSAIRDYRQFQNDEFRTSARMSEFEILGNEFVPATDFVEHPESTWTWAFVLWDEADGRQDILSDVFIVPVPGEPNQTATVDNDTATLSFEVDLHSAPPLASLSGQSSYTFDWSQATVEASGQPFDTAKADRLLIGHVAGAVSDVEASILTVLDSADELYRMEVRGETSADLTLATEKTSGAAFTGFTTDGTWLIGIECTTCTSPTPLILSVVEVSDP